MLRLLSIGGACLLLGLAAGCGGDDGGSGAGGGGANTETEAPAEKTQTSTESSAGGGDKITVHMKDFAFTPAQVSAKVGDTVEWVNDDDAPHNAVQEDGDLKTDTIDKGGTVSYQVDEAGTIDYICTVHPQMKGTITASR